MSSTANLTTGSTLTVQENGNQQPAKFKDLPLKNKVSFILRFITVEPLLCLYIMPSLLTYLAIQNLRWQMICQVNLGYNETICSNLLSPNNSQYETEIQVYMTKITPWQTALSTGLPALMILFFGSYSDRHKKRKPFLLLPIIGEVLASIGLIICSIYLTSLPVEAQVVIETLFPSLTGGLSTMLMTIYSYIADVTTLDGRTLRIGVVHILSSIIIAIGTALSGILFETMKFYIFALSLLFYATGFLYWIFCIKEPRQEVSVEKRNLCVDLFDPRHAIDTFQVVFKNRRGSERLRIILLMLVFIVILGPSFGELNMLFSFTRERFHWEAVETSVFQTYDFVLHLVGTTLAITILSQWLQLDDLLLAVIACISKVAASFLYAFSTTKTLFYFAPAISIISGASVVAIRSIATKLVAQDELGKIQSLFGICEAIAPIVYATIYSQVYAATVKTFPGAYFLMGAALITPAIFIFLIMYILQKKDQQKETEKQDTFKYTVPMSEM